VVVDLIVDGDGDLEVDATFDGIRSAELGSHRRTTGRRGAHTW